MKPSEMNDTFKTRELLEVLRRRRIYFDETQLKDWIRRGIVQTAPVGQGHDRVFSFEQVAFVFVMAVLQQRIRYLAESAGLAQQLMPMVLDIYATGPDGNEVYASPVWALVATGGNNELREIPLGQSCRDLVDLYPTKMPTLISPGEMAIELSAGIWDVLEDRKK